MRKKMPTGALRRGREVVGFPAADYYYVPGGEPFVVGYCKTGGSQDVVEVTNLQQEEAPVVFGVSNVGAPRGYLWLTANQPMASSMAYVWKTPFGGTEFLLAQAIPPESTQELDTRRLRRRRTLLGVMATTQMPSRQVYPVLDEVRSYAAESIIFASWLLTQRFGGSVENLRAWLEEAHPNNSARDSQVIRRVLADGPYADPATYPWNIINTLIRGATRFIHTAS